MAEQSEFVVNALPMEEAVGLSLTENEHEQVQQIARELAGLMGLREDPRIIQAAYDILDLFVVKGGMPIPQAIATLGTSLRMALTRMAEESTRH